MKILKNTAKYKKKKEKETSPTSERQPHHNILLYFHPVILLGIYFWPYHICKFAFCPFLQPTCINLKQAAIFPLLIRDVTSLLPSLFALGRNQRDDPQNKLDTKAKILFHSPPMLRRSSELSLHFPFPLPTAWSMDVVGATLDHSGRGIPLGMGEP